MKILFVCSGNTCRSPMAEGYLKSLKLPALEVLSRAAYGNGDLVSQNSADVLNEIGIDISNHISKQLTPADLDADLIICMTAQHKAALTGLGINPDRIIILGGGISDPFDADITVYRKCRNEIIDGINDIVFGGILSGFSVRYATKDDIYDIAELEKECFSSPWSQNAIDESMTLGTKFFVAERNGNILGYIGASFVCDEGYITNIAVSEKSRNNGVGSYLLARLIAESQDFGLSFLSLEVRTSNKNAIDLYTKFGFLKEGLRKKFYTHPQEDALIMTKRF